MAGWASLMVLIVGALKDLGQLKDIKSSFDVLTDFAMFGAVIFETLAVLAIFVLRRKLPLAPRPYRCLGYPVVPALYVILPACVLANMFLEHRLEAATGTAFILAGVLTYYAFGLRKTGGAQPFQCLAPAANEKTDVLKLLPANPEGIQGPGTTKPF